MARARQPRGLWRFSPCYSLAARAGLRRRSFVDWLHHAGTRRKVLGHAFGLRIGLDGSGHSGQWGSSFHESAGAIVLDGLHLFYPARIEPEAATAAGMVRCAARL